jgi:MFS family permease
VRRLGFVSLLTDVSSEMIYPLLPAFVTGVLGAGPLFLGLVEGAAEATAALVKIGSGALSDRARHKKPLVFAGYGLSSLARPLMALAATPLQVLAVRLADRLGKGVRGAPRDALLAAATAPGERGRAYGFHRAMDNLGAALGPLLAAAALALGCSLRVVFGLAAIPALLSLLVLALGVREDVAERAQSAGRLQSGPGPGTFRRYLVVLAVFTLGNSSDAFLLLRAQDAGVSLAHIPLLWTLHHVVKSSAGTRCGALSDRLGRRRMILVGWGVYALAYLGLALATSSAAVWLLFAAYGLFHALTEGAERALVADLVSAEARGRAFGLYHAVTGAMLLPASLLTGALWQSLGPRLALVTGAALSVLAALGLGLFVAEPKTARGAI